MSPASQRIFSAYQIGEYPNFILSILLSLLFAVSPESALFDDKTKGVAQADHKECTYYYRHVLG